MRLRNYVALHVGLQLPFSLAAAAPAALTKSDAAFSNRDVVKLVKLDLGDNVV